MATIEKPQLTVNNSQVIIENYNSLLQYRATIDGCPIEVTDRVIRLSTLLEGEHVMTISVSNEPSQIQGYSRDEYTVEKAEEIIMWIYQPYASPANVISLKHNSYDGTDFNTKVDYEIWEHPFSETENPPKLVDEIKHGDYHSRTYEGSVYGNMLITSGTSCEDRRTDSRSSFYYRTSDMNNKEYSPKAYNRTWNIENYTNEYFREKLAYRKVKKDDNFYKGEYLESPKEYRTVDTFLEALNYSSTVVKPDILGLDRDIELSYYPCVKKGLYQFYAGWVDNSPFELNERTDPNNGEIFKQSVTKAHTEKARRTKDGTLRTYGTADSDMTNFKIETNKPQFPQLDIDLESVMKDPFVLNNVEEDSNIETTYRLRRAVYRYYCEDEEAQYDYKNVIGDTKYEIIDDFELGNYIWEDGDYILDVWNYRDINRTFRHRSFYFTVNTMKTLDIAPLKAKIIPLNINKCDKSKNEELLLDWITGDYYVNVNGVLKSATVDLNKQVTETEELEFQRIIDAVDYLGMLEDDIIRYNTNRDFIDETMNEVERLYGLYVEYMKVFKEKRDYMTENADYNAIKNDLLKFYTDVSKTEDKMRNLNYNIQTDMDTIERLDKTTANINHGINSIKDKITYFRNNFLNSADIQTDFIQRVQDFMNRQDSILGEYITSKNE